MNDIVKKEAAGAVAINMFEADANQGTDNMSQDDLALPFLKVLGQLSPEINKVHAKYKEGAEPGMILNTVSGQLMMALKVLMYFQFITKDSWLNGKIEALVQVLQLQFTVLKVIS